MSIQLGANGRRSVQVEVEVPGTPEQVWAAVATGAGISAWFVPASVEERAGGVIALDFGGGMVTSSAITAWCPPHSFVAEDSSWLQGGPSVATEWSVTAQANGLCSVRVVHTLVADSDAWDAHLEGTEHGWPGYFRVLRQYLTHHAGQPSASFVLMATASDDARAVWKTLAGALGVPQARVGQAVHIAAEGAAPITGTVEAIDDVPQGQGAMIAVRAPAPGVVLASGMDCMGMRMATLQAFYYGPQASAAAQDRGHWERWLLALFPPPQG